MKEKYLQNNNNNNNIRNRWFFENCTKSENLVIYFMVYYNVRIKKKSYVPHERTFKLNNLFFKYSKTSLLNIFKLYIL